jgi:DNA-directed RNA polymerase subunit L
MEIKTLKKTTKELELEIIGENETILTPIASKLLAHDDVDYAACLVDHPLANKRRLYLRVKKGNPEEILKKTIKELEDEAKEFAKLIKDKKSSK